MPSPEPGYVSPLPCRSDHWHRILQVTARIAFLVIMLFAFHGSPVAAETGAVKQDGGSQAGGAKKMNQTIPVFCTIAGRVDGDNGRVICSEMLSALEVAHPGLPFALADATDTRPSLEIRILLATDNNISLVLGLTGADGKKMETENFAVSAMDRKLTPQSRNSLYHRAIAEIPLSG